MRRDDPQDLTFSRPQSDLNNTRELPGPAQNRYVSILERSPTTVAAQCPHNHGRCLQRLLVTVNSPRTSPGALARIRTLPGVVVDCTIN